MAPLPLVYTPEIEYPKCLAPLVLEEARSSVEQGIDRNSARAPTDRGEITRSQPGRGPKLPDRITLTVAHRSNAAEAYPGECFIIEAGTNPTGNKPPESQMQDEMSLLEASMARTGLHEGPPNRMLGILQRSGVTAGKLELSLLVGSGVAKAYGSVREWRVQRIGSVLSLQRAYEALTCIFQTLSF